MTKEDPKPNGGGGVYEGVARGISQACVYAIEARKSIVQTYGNHASRVVNPQTVIRHMLESAVSSGVIFGFYFTTYNHIGMSNPLAGPISSLATSLVKIPVSNGMRMIQVNRADNLLAATKKIVRMQGVRGLYNGYTLSLIEDMIEFDMRTRLYSAVKTEDNIAANVVLGAFVGMVAAYITTPFDTIRANMTVFGKGAVQTIHTIYKNEGALGFYKGGGLRTCSNGLKYSLFFMFFELLNEHNKSCRSRA